jgi:outer membrane protein, multidrug efflux system
MGSDIETLQLTTGMTSACTVSPLTGGPGKKTRHFLLGCALRWLAAVLAVVAVLAGCTVGPDYKRPEVVVPTNWRNGSVGESIANLGWWQLFEDSTLQELIGTAMVANRDLQLAAARVLEARAQLGIARASQFPQLSAGSSYANERPYSANSFFLKSFPGHIAPPTGNDLQANFDLTFELDLWGRLRRATEAARADLLASEENARAVITTLVSDVAQTYFDLLELDRELAISLRTLETRRASLDLQRRRAEKGLSTQLDVERAAAEVSVAESTVPDLERRIAQTEDALNLLLGRNPGPVARGTTLDNERLPPEVPAGLPSELLERRPEIRQAEQNLIAANARIGEAKAEFFPKISLTGMFGVESVSLSSLFTGASRVWSAGPTMTLPLFTAGRIESNVKAQEAREQQALVQYQHAIQQAFRDVEDALVFHRKVREIRVARARRVGELERALFLANLRYTRGLATYLDVLDAERQLFSAELDLAATTGDQLKSVVQVYKALGGGWEAQPSSTQVTP